MKQRVRAVLISLMLMLIAPAVAWAQFGYFGQNKVQYRAFNFQVLKTQHFDIYYYPEEEAAARMAGRMAERWYLRLSTVFDHQLRNRQAVVLYASGAQFRETNVVEGDLGEGTGGVTEAIKRRVVLPFAGPIQATDHVLGHELVHAFQYDVTNTSAQAASAGAPGILQLPLWFIEGMAEYLSIGPEDPNTAMWMREAVRREKLPDIDKLDNPEYFPYRYGQALWAYIGGKYGDDKIQLLLRSATGRDGYSGAFQRVLGVTTKQLSEGWHADTYRAFRPVAEATQVASSFAKPLIVDETRKGGVNVSPELSPDGSRIAFFSSRDLFSIDLYIADASTGKVIRKITDTATNPHLDSIGFIESAGAWSRDGKEFAFTGLRGDTPVLTIVDVAGGGNEQEKRIKDVDEILTPTWSPDGRHIAFSALVGGFNDLFIYDIESGQLRRLTNDAFAELQPAWSPDGKTIAFSTDRFTTNIDQLRAGSLKIAAIDVATGDVHAIGGYDNAKNINPQWSADSQSLYFISDRQGISNVYRMDLAANTVTQLTNMLTGATGITDLSPALSTSASRLAFSVYEESGYNIYTIDTQQATGLPAVTMLPRDAGVLPPRTRGEGPVFAMLESVQGLPPSEPAAPTQPYKPRLSLDYLGQPAIGFGVDSFGAYVGGGIAASFSDILGNHTVAGVVQLTNRFDETGGAITYLNRTHRWNWGASLDQTPYAIRGFQDALVDAGGTLLVQEQEFRQLQIDRGVSGVVLYPFNRAQRIEFSGGLRQITGKTDVTTRLFDEAGNQLSQDTARLSTFPTLNLGMATSALVYDTSIFGATSPIRGSRYRLEYDQTAGSITYGSVLADYRTYLMPKRPFTIALRGMYYGRYGRSAEDPLLSPVFIGYPDLVRGYDLDSFESQECAPSINGACPVLERLIGSRMIVANAELRFPLWGAFGGTNFYGPLPIELAVFGDAGAAWDSEHSLKLTGANNSLARSVGAAARINLLGFAVAEIDYVRPLDRAGRGWLWQFNFRPGF